MFLSYLMIKYIIHNIMITNNIMIIKNCIIMIKWRRNYTKIVSKMYGLIVG